VKLKPLAGIVSFALLFVAIAGCGGSDEQTLSKREFLVRGNALCLKTVKTQSAVIEELTQEALEDKPAPSDGVDEQRRDEVVKTLSDSLRTLGSELSSLGAPSGDEKQVEDIAQAYEDAGDEAEERPQDFFSGVVLRQPDAAAAAYGLNRCGTM
jgi:hypothetical protein